MKKLSALMLGFASVFFLSGCSAQDRSGTFYETFVKPMDMFLSKIHEYVGSWGWSIVIITLIVRIIILPFMLNNYKTQNKARRGQVLARPELEVVQAKQKAAREKEARAISNEEKTQARAELMELQREQMAIMKKYDAKKEDTEGIVEKILSYYEASVSLFLREEADGKIKGSMRSKYEINVNEVASLFGGGGHYKAAGFSTNLSANEILEIVLKNI